MEETKKFRPISYDSVEEMDKPASELIEELRNQLANIRGKVRDIKRKVGFNDHLECVEGGITCIISTMYNTKKEIENHEKRWGYGGTKKDE